MQYAHPAYLDVSSPSSDDLEAAVIQIWTEFGLRPTAATDDFFALGGQSLQLVRFLAVVQERFGVELPIDALFESDLTVAVAAAAIRRGQLEAVDETQLAAALAELSTLTDQEVAALLADYA